MFLLLKIIIVIALLLFLAGAARTLHENASAAQKAFTAGTVPAPIPDGPYQGSVGDYKVSWKGKKFDAAASRGINMFDDGSGVESEKYPFATATGTGLRDPGVTAVKIDYDIPENPFWVRPILDEIVQVAPGEYLGKIHLRIVPGYPFTIGFFTLKK